MNPMHKEDEKLFFKFLDKINFKVNVLSLVAFYFFIGAFLLMVYFIADYESSNSTFAIVFTSLYPYYLINDEQIIISLLTFIVLGLLFLKVSKISSK